MSSAFPLSEVAHQSNSALEFDKKLRAGSIPIPCLDVDGNLHGVARMLRSPASGPFSWEYPHKVEAENKYLIYFGGSPIISPFLVFAIPWKEVNHPVRDVIPAGSTMRRIIKQTTSDPATQLLRLVQKDDGGIMLDIRELDVDHDFIETVWFGQDYFRGNELKYISNALKMSTV